MVVIQAFATDFCFSSKGLDGFVFQRGWSSQGFGFWFGFSKVQKSFFMVLDGIKKGQVLCSWLSLGLDQASQDSVWLSSGLDQASQDSVWLSLGLDQASQDSVWLSLGLDQASQDSVWLSSGLDFSLLTIQRWLVISVFLNLFDHRAKPFDFGSIIVDKPFFPSTLSPMILKITQSGCAFQWFYLRVRGVKNPRIAAGIKNVERNAHLFRVVRAVFRVRIKKQGRVFCLGQRGRKGGLGLKQSSIRQFKEKEAFRDSEMISITGRFYSIPGLN
jgi:hypothetical protein